MTARLELDLLYRPYRPPRRRRHRRCCPAVAPLGPVFYTLRLRSTQRLRTLTVTTRRNHLHLAQKLYKSPVSS